MDKSEPLPQLVVRRRIGIGPFPERLFFLFGAEPSADSCLSVFASAFLESAEVVTGAG